MRKDILIITSYFPPEIGAASNRIFHLAEGLSQHNFNVQVITPLPNYPTGKIFDDYKGSFRKSSKENEVTIHRLWIFASNSKNKLLRLFAMLSYSFSLVWFFVFNTITKTVIVQSPPLIVAFTCMLFLKKKKRKLILNVSDLWPIAGLELGALKRNFSYSILEKIERFNYRRANLVLGQSEEIITHVKSLFPNKETFLYRNYPDFKTPKIEENQNTSDGKIKIVYAGLLGVAQGVFKLIQQLEYSNIELHLYGNGSEKEQIENYLLENRSLPVFCHGEMSRHQLHKELLKYDFTIIPLLNRIYGSVPSKIFEYARLGLPMLYFGGGEGEVIMSKFNLGWVAEAGNYSALNNLIASISKNDLPVSRKKNIQEIAVNNFDFNNQINALERFI